MGLRLPSSMPRRHAVGAVVLIALALAVLSAFAGTSDGLAYLLPALVLAVTLAAGRYPGERALRALGSPRSGARTRRGATVARPSTGPPRGTVPRGGGLLAASLAVRPPPRLLSAHS